MSETTEALEAAVATALEIRAAGGGALTARQRAALDKAYARVLRLIAPRIRHFIRQYGLAAHWEDAEQCCAIAVHRAIEDYDPTKAQFTTFVNWQLRGELQSLRFRLMTDQRPSARKAGARTVSLNALGSGADGEELSIENIVEDEDALDRTTEGASDYLALRAARALVDAYMEQQRAQGIAQLQRRPLAKRTLAAMNTDERLAWQRQRAESCGVDPDALAELDERLSHDRYVIEHRMFAMDLPADAAQEAWVTKERVRQVTRRAGRAFAEMASADQRFRVMADYAAPGGTGDAE